MTHAAVRFAPALAATALAVAQMWSPIAAAADGPAPAAADASAAPDAPAVSSAAVFPLPEARTNLLIVGSGIAVGWYGVALGFSYLDADQPSPDKLRIPVAGPWMAIADAGCPATDPDCSTFLVGLRVALAALSGLGQLGGLAVVGEGLFMPTRSESVTRGEARAPGAAPRALVTPLLGPGTLGLGVGGFF